MEACDDVTIFKTSFRPMQYTLARAPTTATATETETETETGGGGGASLDDHDHKRFYESPQTLMKLVVDTATDRVLGAHMVVRPSTRHENACARACVRGVRTCVRACARASAPAQRKRGWVMCHLLCGLKVGQPVCALRGVVVAECHPPRCCVVSHAHTRSALPTFLPAFRRSPWSPIHTKRVCLFVCLSGPGRRRDHPRIGRGDESGSNQSTLRRHYRRPPVRGRGVRDDA